MCGCNVRDRESSGKRNGRNSHGRCGPGLVVPLAEEVLASEGQGRTWATGALMRFPSFTQGGVIVSSQCLWGKGASSPAPTATGAPTSLPLWGGSGHSWRASWGPSSTYPVRQPEDPRTSPQSWGVLTSHLPPSCLQRAEFPGPGSGNSSGVPGGTWEDR